MIVYIGRQFLFSSYSLLTHPTILWKYTRSDSIIWTSFWRYSKYIIWNIYKFRREKKTQNFALIYPKTVNIQFGKYNLKSLTGSMPIPPSMAIDHPHRISCRISSKLSQTELPISTLPPSMIPRQEPPQGLPAQVVLEPIYSLVQVWPMDGKWCNTI